MTAHVSKVANVIIPVADQDRALAFYTESLGLEKRVDVPFGDGDRWIEVAPCRRRHADRDLPSRPEHEPPAARTPASRCRPTTSTPTTRS